MTESQPGAAERLALYRTMLLIRRFEEKAGQLYAMGLIGGYCHLSIGQEAVAAGLRAAMREGDRLVATYRGHAHMLAAGMDAGAMMAELAGRDSGTGGGRGGSMHLFDPARGVYGGQGMLGATAPLGAGLALAARHRGDGSAGIAVLGDVAAGQGQVFEAFGLAARLSLPCLFVIEDNRDGEARAEAEGRGEPPLAERGAAFGIAGETVDGMDALAVAEAAGRALAEVRAGRPRILEARTHRYRGHSMADPDKYRHREEDARARARHDPLDRLRERLVAGGVAEAALREADAEVKAIVAAAATEAQRSPEPDPARLAEHVVLEAGA